MHSWSLESTGGAYSFKIGNIQNFLELTNKPLFKDLSIRSLPKLQSSDDSSIVGEIHQGSRAKVVMTWL